MKVFSRLEPALVLTLCDPARDPYGPHSRRPSCPKLSPSRQPAQSLRARLDGLSEDISLYLAMALMFPFMVSTMYFADMWARGVTLAESRWLMLLLLAEVRSPAAGFSPMEQQPGATP